MNDNREHEQFTFLYKKYYSELYYFARKVLGSDDVAEDIVQETFLVAYKKLDDLLGSPSPKGWLYKVLRHIMGDNYRNRARLAETIRITEGIDSPTNDAVNIRLELEGTIGKDDLDILIKVYVERYTYKEVSALYGTTVDAAKKRAQRAKAKLRLELEK